MQSYNDFIDNDIRNFLMIYQYNNLNKNDKKILPMSSINKYMLNESHLDTLSTKAKEVLSKICNSVGDIVNFLKSIKDNLYKELNKVLTDTKGKIKEKLKGDSKLINIIKHSINSDKNAFYKDVMTCKEVSHFYTSKFTDSILNHVYKSLKDLLLHKKHDVFDEIKESLNVKIVDDVIHHLHKIPPFSWLDMLHHKGACGAEHLIKGLSYITKRLGGPEFELPVISSILGLAFEYNIKGLIKHGLLEASEFLSIPFVAMIIKTAGNVATFLACYELCHEMCISTEEYYKTHNHVHDVHSSVNTHATKKHILNRNDFIRRQN